MLYNLQIILQAVLCLGLTKKGDWLIRKKVKLCLWLLYVILICSWSLAPLLASLHFSSSIAVSSKICLFTKGALQGAFQPSRSPRWPDFPCPLEPGFGAMPLISALSQLHIYFFPCFCTINHTQSFKGHLFPQMAFTSCHDQGSNMLPPDGRGSTLATQPLRLAYGILY